LKGLPKPTPRTLRPRESFLTITHAASVATPSSLTRAIVTPFPAATVARPMGTMPVPGSYLFGGVVPCDASAGSDHGAHELRQFIDPDGRDLDALASRRVRFTCPIPAQSDSRKSRAAAIPAEGVTAGSADILITRVEVDRFEQQHGLFVVAGMREGHQPGRKGTQVRARRHATSGTRSMQRSRAGFMNMEFRRRGPS
jgi:hypothetical protein